MDLRERLAEIVGAAAVCANAPLARYTSFQIGGPVPWLVEPGSEEEIRQVVALCREASVPLNVLGLGSNVLVADRGMPGVVMRLAERFSQIKVVELADDEAAEAVGVSSGDADARGSGDVGDAGDAGGTCGASDDAEVVLLAVQAGASNEAVAAFALEQGLSGYAFASGIPGSIGGAAIMNAGAYGGEFKDVTRSVRCLTSEGEIVEVAARDADWSYRRSMMMERGYVVLGATIALRRGDRAVIAAEMADLKRRREEKQPLEMPSAGSTFKRPEGHYAGQLIEEAGLRGYEIGGAQVSDKHCGFVVNAHQATAQDVRDLIAYVRERVHDTSGVYLEPEVRLWGF